MSEILYSDGGSRLDLKNVLTFITVAREMSFAQASYLLEVSQPSVTARIQSLEAELGKSLFVRKKRNIQLTKEGEAFFPYALRLLEIESEAKEKLLSLHHQLVGKITIGATAFWSVYILPEILGGILKSYPGIEIKVVTGTTPKIAEMLVQNQVDIGLVSSRVKKGGILEHILTESEISLVCQSNHPYAKELIELDDMLKAPIVTYQQASDAWKRIKQVYSEHQAKPNIVMELNQIEAAKQMVLRSSTLCFLPTLSVKKELENQQLAKVSVNGFPTIMESLVMIHLEQKESYQVIKLVLDLLKRKIENKILD